MIAFICLFISLFVPLFVKLFAFVFSMCHSSTSFHLTHSTARLCYWLLVLIGVLTFHFSSWKPWFEIFNLYFVRIFVICNRIWMKSDRSCKTGYFHTSKSIEVYERFVLLWVFWHLTFLRSHLTQQIVSKWTVMIIFW